MKCAVEQGYKKIEVRTDSQYVIDGSSKDNTRNEKDFAQLMKLCNQIEVTWVCVIYVISMYMFKCRPSSRVGPIQCIIHFKDTHYTRGSKHYASYRMMLKSIRKLNSIRHGKIGNRNGSVISLPTCQFMHAVNMYIHIIVMCACSNDSIYVFLHVSRPMLRVTVIHISRLQINWPRKVLERQLGNVPRSWHQPAVLT